MMSIGGARPGSAAVPELYLPPGDTPRTSGEARVMCCALGVLGRCGSILLATAAGANVVEGGGVGEELADWPRNPEWKFRTSATTCGCARTSRRSIPEDFRRATMSSGSPSNPDLLF